MGKNGLCKGCGLEADHDGFCGESRQPKSGEVIDLLNMPDHVVFSEESLKSMVTKVDVPLYLPDGAIVGKARIIGSEGKDAVLIELETTDPIVASLFKSELIGMSIFHRPSSPSD